MLKLSVPTHAREEMVDVTAALRAEVKKNGWNDGILTVFTPHTTCGLTINEGFDPDVPRDMLAFLKARIPQDWGFRHGEGNSDAHLKASLMGSSVQLIVEGGEILVGTWQAVWFFEADGPRNRQIWLKWMGE